MASPKNSTRYFKNSPKGTDSLNCYSKLIQKNPVSLVQSSSQGNWEKGSLVTGPKERMDVPCKALMAKVLGWTVTACPTCFDGWESTLPCLHTQTHVHGRHSSQLQCLIVKMFEWRPTRVSRGHRSAQWSRKGYILRCTKAERQQLRGKV